MSFCFSISDDSEDFYGKGFCFFRGVAFIDDSDYVFKITMFVVMIVRMFMMVFMLVQMIM